MINVKKLLTEGNETLLITLAETYNAISAARNEILALTTKDALFRTKMNKARTEALSQVLNAKDNDGKNIYTNEKSRELATEQFLKRNEDYCISVQETETISWRLKELSNEIERLKNESKLLHRCLDVSLEGDER